VKPQTWTEPSATGSKHPGPIQIVFKPPFDKIAKNCRAKSYTVDRENHYMSIAFGSRNAR